MNAPMLAGIDVGTSSLKVVLLDDSGHVVGAATADYRIQSTKPGEAEQDPQLWWRALQHALSQALGACGGQAEALKAMCVSGQMHGVVALDRQARLLRPAILWADQRGAAEVEQIERLIDRSALLAHTGNRASVGFTAPKVLWLRRHEPDVFARCVHLLQPKDYLRFRLTGEMATEPTDASATLLFDLERRIWSDQLLNLLELPQSLFAPVQHSLAVVGTVMPEVAAELGIPAGLPVIAGAGDTPAQAIGYGMLQPNRVLATISSGGQLFATLDTPKIDPQGRVHTLCHVLPDHWYLLGALQAAGLALRWFHEQFARDIERHDYEQLVAEAAAVPPGANGLTFLPYLLGERTPHMDNTARAVFFGFTLNHDRAAAVRAVLEGVAFAFRDALSVCRELDLTVDEVRLGGGGGRSQVWRKIFADVLGLPIVRTNAEHGAAFGAALMAGVGIGHFRSLQEIASDKTFVVDRDEPDEQHVARYNEVYDTYRGLYASLRPHFQSIAR